MRDAPAILRRPVARSFKSRTGDTRTRRPFIGQLAQRRIVTDNEWEEEQCRQHQRDASCDGHAVPAG